MRNLKTVIILSLAEAKLDIAKNFAQMVYDNPEMLLEGTPIPRFDNMDPREVAELHENLSLGKQYKYILNEDDTGRIRDDLELVLVQTSDYDYVTVWDSRTPDA